MGVVVWVWVLVRVRVPAWMPVAAHHGIRWLYGRVRRSAGWRRELCRGKRWVAQEDSRTGESKGSGIRADAVQLRSRHRQRMNRLAALVEGLGKQACHWFVLAAGERAAAM